MRHIIETGTDVATLCFFDPAALPADFDADLQRRGFELFDALAAEGRLWWMSTHADGGYTFHFYVDEDTPEELRQYIGEQALTARFHVPSGVIWCCGTEFAQRQPDTGRANWLRNGLAKYPHMGGKLTLAPGEYAMTISELDEPEDLVEDRIRAAVGPGAWLWESMLGPVCGFLFFGGCISLIILLCTLSRTWWAWLLASCAVTLGLAIGKKLENSPEGKRRRAIQSEYPAYVVTLFRLSTSIAVP